MQNLYNGYSSNEDAHYNVEFGTTTTNSSPFGAEIYFFRYYSDTNAYAVIWDNNKSAYPVRNTNSSSGIEDRTFYVVRIKNGTIEMIDSYKPMKSTYNGNGSSIWNLDINVHDNKASINVTGSDTFSFSNIDVSEQSLFGNTSFRESTQAFAIAYGKYLYFNNNKITLYKSKTVSQLLNENQLRPNAKKFIINLQDSGNIDVDINRCLNDEMHYIGLGKSNQTTTQNFINQNEGRGTWINNSSLGDSNDPSDAIVKQIVNYIKSVVTKRSDTIVAGETARTIVTNPVDGNIDNVTEDYLTGVWSANHDENYYENKQNKYYRDGIYSKDLIQEYENVGKYEISYKDNPIKNVYVNRKPVADFNINTDFNSDEKKVVLKSDSYDLDLEPNSSDYEIQRNNNGIKTEKWEVRKSDETTWTEMPSNSIGENVNYEFTDTGICYIRLTVEDYQGMKSSVIKNVSVDSLASANKGVVAGFEIDSECEYDYRLFIDEKLNVSNKSYINYVGQLENGETLEIANNTWKIYYGGEEIYTSTDKDLSDMDINSLDCGAGIYTIELQVTTNEVQYMDGEEIKTKTFSDTISKKIRVIRDRKAPKISPSIDEFKLENYKDGEYIDLNVNFSFEDKLNGLKNFKYTINDNDDDVYEYENTVELSGKEATATVVIPKTSYGNNYIHINAEDNQGYEVDEVYGPYYIEAEYKFMVYTGDKDKGKLPIAGVHYDIMAETKEGNLITIAEDVVSDNTGCIPLVQSKLRNIKKIRIVNRTIPAGYKSIRLKWVNVNIEDFKIVTKNNNLNTDDGEKLEVSYENNNDGKLLKVWLMAERDEADIQIINTDEFGYFIPDSEFEISDPITGYSYKNKTDKDGKVILKTKSSRNAEVTYTLEETNVNNNYTSSGATEIKIKYSENGRIEKVTKADDSNSLYNVHQTDIAKVTAISNRMDSSSFNVNLKVTENNGTAVEKSKYKINITGNGLDYTTKEVESDSNGNILFQGLYGHDALKLTIQNVNAPGGFAKEPDRIVNINRSSTDDTIQIVTKDSNINVIGLNGSKNLSIEVKNNKKESKNAIEIDVKLKGFGEVKIPGINFSLINIFHPDTIVASGTTDENGKLELLDINMEYEEGNDLVDETSEQVYMLKTDMPSLFGDDLSVFNFEVSYNNSTRFINGIDKIDELDGLKVYSDIIKDDSQYIKYAAHLDFSLTPGKAEGSNKVKIKQLGMSGNVLAGVKYLTVINGDNINPIYNVVETDVNGYADVYIPDINDVKLSLREIATSIPDGYKLNSATKVIKMDWSESGLHVNDFENINPNDIREINDGSPDNGNVELTVESKYVKDMSITFKIIKRDEHGNAYLRDVEYKISSIDYTQFLKTNRLGYDVVGTPFEAKFDGPNSYTFNIEETEQISPYKKPENITLEISVNNNTGKVMYEGIDCDDPESILLNAPNVQYDESSNNLNVTLELKSIIDPEALGKKVNIDFKKIKMKDSEKIEVTGSEYDAEIIGFAARSQLYSKANGNSLKIMNGKDEIELPDLLIKGQDDREKTTIILKESKEADGGCAIDSDIKTLTLYVENGAVKLDQENSTRENIIINEPVVNSDTGIATIVIELIADDLKATKEPITDLTFNIFNKELPENWNYVYRKISGTTIENVTENMDGKQRLLKTFKGYNGNIQSAELGDVVIEARPLVNGVPSEDDVEEQTLNLRHVADNVKEAKGAYTAKFLKDYSDKTVQFTIKQYTAKSDYEPLTSENQELKFTLTFNKDRTIASGTIENDEAVGITSAEPKIAIGGISANGEVDNIKFMEAEWSKQGWKNYVPNPAENINDFNSIDSGEVYLALFNKKIPPEPASTDPIEPSLVFNVFSKEIKDWNYTYPKVTGGNVGSETAEMSGAQRLYKIFKDETAAFINDEPDTYLDVYVVTDQGDILYESVAIKKADDASLSNYVGITNTVSNEKGSHKAVLTKDVKGKTIKVKVRKESQRVTNAYGITEDVNTDGYKAIDPTIEFEMIIRNDGTIESVRPISGNEISDEQKPQYAIGGVSSLGVSSVDLIGSEVDGARTNATMDLSSYNTLKDNSKEVYLGLLYEKDPNSIASVPTLTFNIFNKELTTWSYKYDSEYECQNDNGELETDQDKVIGTLVNDERLYRAFKENNYFITKDLDITITARLIDENGDLLSGGQEYEKNGNINDRNHRGDGTLKAIRTTQDTDIAEKGSHILHLYKDYRDKNVRFTIHQNSPIQGYMNLSDSQNDIQFDVKFNSEGVIENIIQINGRGKDITEEDAQYAIGGVSANKATSTKIKKAEDKEGKETYDEYDLSNYNSLKEGSKEIYLGLFNQKQSESTLTLKIFNKSINKDKSWNYKYYNTSRTLDNEQRLPLIFQTKGNYTKSPYGQRIGDSHNYIAQVTPAHLNKRLKIDYIDTAECYVDARLMDGDRVIPNIYETVRVKSVTPTLKGGSHIAEFKENYKDKKVQFTIRQKIADRDHKRNTKDATFILNFDSYGKVMDGNIPAGENDLVDFAVAGISADKIVDNIKYTVVPYYHENITTDVKDYDSLSETNKKKKEVYVGLINQKITANPIKINVKIIDKDTEDILKGRIKVSIFDLSKDKDTRTPITDEPKTGNNVGGSVNIKQIDKKEITVETKHTYTNRKLKIKIEQNNQATLDGLEYEDSTMNYAEFIVETDDLGDIVNVSPANGKAEDTSNPLNLPKNITYGGRQGQNLSLTFKNTFSYDFAIKVKTVDERGRALQGIRINNIGYKLEHSDRELPQELGTKIWKKYGSMKTGTDGTTLLKVQFKKQPDDYYTSKQPDQLRVFALNEYVAANGYTLQENVDLRILFKSNMEIEGTPFTSRTDILSVDTNPNNYLDGVLYKGKNDEGREITMVNVTIENEKMKAKPELYIDSFNANEDVMDFDSPDRTIGGITYKVEVFDKDISGTPIKDYNLDETKYGTTAMATDVITGKIKGQTNINFYNTHAGTKSMVYRITQEDTQATPFPTDYTRIENPVDVLVEYDGKGNIAKTPKIINSSKVPNVQNSLGQKTKAAKIIGDYTEPTTQIMIEFRNEEASKFKINLKKELNGVEQADRDFYIEAQDMANILSMSVEETRNSVYKNKDHDLYEVGFVCDVHSKSKIYNIYERINENHSVKRGTLKVEFDAKGKVISAEVVGTELYIHNNDPTDKKDDHLVIEKNKQSVTVKIEAQSFYMDVNVRNTTGSNWSYKGYKFIVENDKEENNIEIDGSVKTDTSSSGLFRQKLGEIYKGETVHYKITQKECAIDYNDIPEFEFDVKFSNSGAIISCDPSSQPNVYTATSSGDGVDVEVYTTAAVRNSIEMKLYDEEDPTKEITTGSYEVKGNGETTSFNITNDCDLGSYKKIKTSEVHYTIQQLSSDVTHMVNVNPIEMTVSYDNETGYITGEPVITYGENTDNYVTVDPKTWEPNNSKIYLKTLNKRKPVMKVTEISTQPDGEKVRSSQIKIIEFSKKTHPAAVHYQGLGTTNNDGEATLYVGPYYASEDENQPVAIKYELTNPVHGFGFSTIQPTTFTLYYDTNGMVVGEPTVDDPAVLDYITITLPENNGQEIEENGQIKKIPDVEIQVKADPLFTVGVVTVDSDTTNGVVKLGNAQFVITEEGSSNQGSVTTSSVGSIDVTQHAEVGETTKGETKIYDIIERRAPSGYKYKNKDNIIGKISVKYDEDGYIVRDKTQIISGNEYITMKNTTDKNVRYDLDIEIKYDEIEEFKIIIENENKSDSNAKIVSDFSATFGDSTYTFNASGTTDPDFGETILNFGAMTMTNTGNRTMTAIINQTNVPKGLIQCSPIKLNITIDPSGKVAAVNGVSDIGYAVWGESVEEEISQRKQYSIRLIVKNNPYITMQITSVEEKDNSIKHYNCYYIYDIKDPRTSLAAEFTNRDTGTAICELKETPKDDTVQYVIQDFPSWYSYWPPSDNGDMKIILNVQFNSDGLVDKIEIDRDSPIKGNRVKIKSNPINRPISMINLEVQFEDSIHMYVHAVDAFDSRKGIENVELFIVDDVLKTPASGCVSKYIGTAPVNKTVKYKVSGWLDNVPGYCDKISSSATITVKYGNNGEILDCIANSNNGLITVNYEGGSWIDVEVKFIPLLNVDLIRRNSTSNAGLNGREITLSTEEKSVLNSKAEWEFDNDTKEYKLGVVTDTNGMVNDLDFGTISNDSVIRYRLVETQPQTNTGNLDSLPTILFDVYFDHLGNVSNIVQVSPTNQVFLDYSGSGTRNIDLFIGTPQKLYMSAIAMDKYQPINKLNGTFVLEKENGNILQLNGTTNINSERKIEVDKMLPDTVVKYKLRQTNVADHYLKIPDTEITVTYDSQGKITNVQSDNPEYVRLPDDTNLTHTSDILLPIYNKPIFYMNLNVTDKLYGDALENVRFKVEDSQGNLTNDITVTDNLKSTDANGNLCLEIDSGLENTEETYTVTQVNTPSGYNSVSFDVVVKYGAGGVITAEPEIQNSTGDVTVTKQYHENANSQGMKAIELKVQLQQELTIGIENTNVESQPLENVRYSITSKEIVDEGEGTTVSKQNVTNANGEMIETFGTFPETEIVEYTISQVRGPSGGYRKAGDAIVRVYYTTVTRQDGVKYQKIYDHKIIKQIEGTKIEVADGSSLLKMTKSGEKVHIKISTVSDKKVLLKIINTEKRNNKPIQGAKFYITANGKPTTPTDPETNADGEILLDGMDVDENGFLRIDYQQIALPRGYVPNPNNNGFIRISKPDNEYVLNYEESNNVNLNMLNIDSIEGMITIKLQNETRLELNLYDVDTGSMAEIDGVKHNIIANVGDLTDSIEDILQNEENKIEYTNKNGNPILSNTDGVIKLALGSTEQFKDKKIVLTIKTPEQVAGFEEMKDQMIVFECNEEGRIKKVYNQSYDFVRLIEDSGYGIDAVLGYEGEESHNDYYTVRVLKKTKLTNKTVNGVKFDAKVEQKDQDGETWNELASKEDVTSDIVVSEDKLETGLIELRNLKQTGHIKVTLDEKETPVGYKGIDEPQVEEFDVELKEIITENSETQNEPSEAGNDSGETGDDSGETGNDSGETGNDSGETGDDSGEIGNGDNTSTNVEKDYELIVTGNSSNVIVDNNTRQITIIVENDQILGINFTSVNSDDAAIIGQEYTVGIKEDNGSINEVETEYIRTKDNKLKHVTDDDGKVEIETLNKYAGKHISIYIHKENEDDYIPEFFLVKFSVELDASGNIIEGSLQCNNGDIVVEKSNTENIITLKLRNELNPKTNRYKLIINKTDINDSDVKLRAYFQVKQMPEDTTIMQTKKGGWTKNGVFEIGGLYGNGKASMEVLEVGTIKGYESHEEPFTYEINNTDGTIQKVNSSEPDNTWETISEIGNKQVIVNITNTPTKHALGFVQVDADDEAIKIKGIKYELMKDTDEDGVLDVVAEGESNENGLIYFLIDDTDGEVTYTLHEKEDDTPDGYIRNEEDATITVDLDSNTNTMNLNSCTGMTPINEGENPRYIKSTIKHTKLDSLLAYNVELENLNGINMPIENATYDITVKNSIGTSEIIAKDKKTDAEGKVKLNGINGAGKITVDVVSKEEAALGYGVDVPNVTSGFVKLEKDEASGTVHINEMKNVTATYEEITKTLKITKLSKEADNKYTLNIKVMNRENGKIINSESSARYEIELDGQIIEASPNDEGEIILTNQDIPDKTSFDIKIKEINTPTGQTQLTKEQVIKANVAQMNGVRVLSDANIISGRNTNIYSKAQSAIGLNLLYPEEEEPEEPEPDPLYVRSEKYLVEEGYISNIKAAMVKNGTTLDVTTIGEFKENIDTNGEIRMYDMNGEEITNEEEQVGTYMRMKVTKDEEEKEFILAVRGDLLGTGKLDVVDQNWKGELYVTVRLWERGLNDEDDEGAAMRAGDVDKSGKIEVYDDYYLITSVLARGFEIEDEE